MKHTFNKNLIGLLFVLIFICIPDSKIEALSFDSYPFGVITNINNSYITNTDENINISTLVELYNPISYDDKNSCKDPCWANREHRFYHGEWYSYADWVLSAIDPSHEYIGNSPDITLYAEILRPDGEKVGNTINLLGSENKKLSSLSGEVGVNIPNQFSNNASITPPEAAGDYILKIYGTSNVWVREESCWGGFDDILGGICNPLFFLEENNQESLVIYQTIPFTVTDNPKVDIVGSKPGWDSSKAINKGEQVSLKYLPIGYNFPINCKIYTKGATLIGGNQVENSILEEVVAAKSELLSKNFINIIPPVTQKYFTRCIGTPWPIISPIEIDDGSLPSAPLYGCAIDTKLKALPYMEETSPNEHCFIRHRSNCTFDKYYSENGLGYSCKYIGTVDDDDVSPPSTFTPTQPTVPTTPSFNSQCMIDESIDPIVNFKNMPENTQCGIRTSSNCTNMKYYTVQDTYTCKIPAINIEGLQ